MAEENEVPEMEPAKEQLIPNDSEEKNNTQQRARETNTLVDLFHLFTACWSAMNTASRVEPPAQVRFTCF